jgi:hypothetical protein
MPPRMPDAHDLRTGRWQALRLPNVMVLVVEDACAVIALRDWQRREPPRWRFWLSLGVLLDAGVITPVRMSRPASLY